MISLLESNMFSTWHCNTAKWFQLPIILRLTWDTNHMKASTCPSHQERALLPFKPLDAVIASLTCTALFKREPELHADTWAFENFPRGILNFLGCLFLDCCTLVAQTVKNPPAMRKTWVRPLGWEDPWRRAWQPILAFLPKESHGNRSLVGYRPWGCK